MPSALSCRLLGVDWGTVASYVDLSEELSLFDSGASAVASQRDGREGEERRKQQGPCQQVDLEGEPQEAAAAPPPGLAAAAQLQQGEELFESPGWAAPSADSGSSSRRRAAALAALG